MEEGVENVVEHVVDTETRKVFSTYTCRSIDENIGLAHPGDIAEPSSLRYATIQCKHLGIYSSTPTLLFITIIHQCGAPPPHLLPAV